MLNEGKKRIKKGKLARLLPFCCYLKLFTVCNTRVSTELYSSFLFVLMFCFFKNLRKKNIENLAIVCPAFTMDCLETLEEIGIEEKESWEKLGGKKFKLISCVNSSDIWSNNICKIIHDQIK